MPADALPVPRAQQPAGLVRLHRAYLDALRRPLVGEVTIAGAQRAATDTTVTVAADVKARVVNGILEVYLPPGTYQLSASLRTVDGVAVADRHEVTLS